jgi:hypothetical protein
MTTRTAFAILAGLALSTLAGCGNKERPYQPKPAYSGKKANLPAVPALPNKAKKEGDAYTVWGAIHDLRSEVHAKDFEGKEVSIVGFIVKTNMETACQDDKKPAEGEDPCVPKCAVHKQGKADADDCAPPIPAFWIAEHADEKDFKTKAIPIKGWASNFAAVFSMVEEIDNKDDKAELVDTYSQNKLPNPLPNLGAKVKVTGTYGVTAATSSRGSESNPRTGILKVTKIEYLEKPKLRSFLPGMKIRTAENKK